MSTSIKVENLSKIYRLGQIGTGTISQDVQRWITTKVLRKEDPFLKIGQANDRTQKGSSNLVYSLQDINFEIEQGDAVGIIGRNGAGKSTLLKILSRVTSPTTGKINIKGRVASLLEVGTGFHPELTGRENIFLNGAILGMRKKEIQRKLDEIIDFSGIERYIDTPVKRYSSGMYVRLAFAVAAHLESEILIVDEVLAVGDAEFQKKCLGKMGDVRNKDGRTVLFVSHNMASITNLCTSCLVIENGEIKQNGSVINGVNSYLNQQNNQEIESFSSHRENRVQLRGLKIAQITQSSFSIKVGDKFEMEMEFDLAEKNVKEIAILIVIRNELGNTEIYRGFSDTIKIRQNQNKIKITTDHLSLNSGFYQVYIAISNGQKTLFYDLLDINTGLPLLAIKPKGAINQLKNNLFDLNIKINTI